MELYKGRPQSTEGRLDREVRVYDLLDSLGIEYLRTDHAHADTMDACNEIDKVLDVLICKNLFLCNKGAFKSDKFGKAFVCLSRGNGGVP